MGLGSEIRDPEKTYSGSRIQGAKRHRIPDPDPQHWLLVSLLLLTFLAMLGIRDILVQIQIPGSILLTNGSGSNCTLLSYEAAC